MNHTTSSEHAPAKASGEDLTSALFASMVMQQTNMAFILLGKVPHPETGHTTRDIESAKMFIDQLEMLEVKTRGNLDKQENKLLKQSLAALRMAFVEAVDAQAPPPAAAAAPAEPANTAKPGEQPVPGTVPAPDEESRKKFSKKY